MYVQHQQLVAWVLLKTPVQKILTTFLNCNSPTPQAAAGECGFVIEIIMISIGKQSSIAVLNFPLQCAVVVLFEDQVYRSCFEILTFLY